MLNAAFVLRCEIQKCYVSLVEDLDFADAKCIQLSVSKLLGIAIVAGGSVMKVPQILLGMNFEVCCIYFISHSFLSSRKSRDVSGSLVLSLRARDFGVYH